MWRRIFFQHHNLKMSQNRRRRRRMSLLSHRTQRFCAAPENRTQLSCFFQQKKKNVLRLLPLRRRPPSVPQGPDQPGFVLDTRSFSVQQRHQGPGWGQQSTSCPGPGLMFFMYLHTADRDISWLQYGSGTPPPRVSRWDRFGSRFSFSSALYGEVETCHPSFRTHSVASTGSDLISSLSHDWWVTASLLCLKIGGSG